MKEEAEGFETPVEIIGDEASQKIAKEKIEDLTEDVTLKAMRLTEEAKKNKQNTTFTR